MTSKSDNKRFAVKRLRRALNAANIPPTKVGMALTGANWGTGPNLKRGIDAASTPAEPYPEVVFCWDLGEFDTEADFFRADNDTTDWKRYAQCAA